MTGVQTCALPISCTDVITDLRNWIWKDKPFTLTSTGSNHLAKIAIILADVESAFDNINQKDIIEALMMAGVENKWVNLIVSFLINRRVGTRENGKIKCKKLTTGTPAGSGLGPYLFIVGFQKRLNLINEIKIGKEHHGRPETEIKALMYADDIIMLVKSGGAKICTNTLQAMERMKSIISGNGLDILPQKSKVITSQQVAQYFDERQITSVREAKMLGCHYEHGLNSTNVREIFRDAEINIHQKIRSIKTLAALPNKIRRILDNSYLRTKLFTYAPLIVRQVLNTKTLQKEGERIYGYLYRATGRWHNQRKREIWTYIFEGGSFLSKLLTISLRYFYRRMTKESTTDIEFQELLTKYPELGPRPLIYHENWSTEHMIKAIVNEFMLKRFRDKYGKRVANFIPANLKRCRSRKQSRLDRFIVGNYDFMYDHTVPCNCKKGSAIPWHVLNYCENFTTWKMRIKQIVARDYTNDGWMIDKLDDPRVNKLIWIMSKSIEHAKIQ